jgi:hypothetical protein
MSTAQEPLAMYLHLARASQQRQRPLVRDKMLLLAGAIAAERGLDQVAACCRQRVLAHNAGHLIGQYATFSTALEDERFQTYLRKLRRDFPLEKAEHMLDLLGIQLAGERETYYTAHEYAASLLGVTPEELERRFGESAQAVTVEGAASTKESQPAVLAPRPPRERIRFRAVCVVISVVLALLAVLLWFWRHR